MTKPSLSQLYQTLTAPQSLSARALVDADTALRAAAGRIVPHERGEVVDALAGSAAHADLVRFLSALEPSSAQLAHCLAQAAPAHGLRERSRRSAHGRRSRERGWQWGAMAASVVAALALFAAHSGQHTQMAGQSALARLQAPAAQPDSIFAAVESPSDARGDEIFRYGGGDNPLNDRIFRTPSDS
ncbi:hypothetical protein [Tahibacter harae]|uniref:RseA-like anti sigma(E) protein n=1 Tax=Tahibacter harae TaxID=2963937 RepID=A0ABT1QNJ5_9GAMM|nr:hypothetical protein [Tahibacter harae]MCQ4164052.1 hypothetical protein [Tahibacter harae]